jgi:hypothetical protein
MKFPRTASRFALGSIDAKLNGEAEKVNPPHDVNWSGSLPRIGKSAKPVAVQCRCLEPHYEPSSTQAADSRERIAADLIRLGAGGVFRAVQHGHPGSVC